jgi:hypothetical protein
VTPVQHTVRLSVSLDKALRALAARQGTSVYAALQRSVETGIAALANRPEHDTTIREIVAELASLSTRLADVERMGERTLFTACAAYCYARSAATGTRKADDVITAEIHAAYDRQRRLSQLTVGDAMTKLDELAEDAQGGNATSSGISERCSQIWKQNAGSESG